MLLQYSQCSLQQTCTAFERGRSAKQRPATCDSSPVHVTAVVRKLIPHQEKGCCSISKHQFHCAGTAVRINTPAGVVCCICLGPAAVLAPEPFPAVAEAALAYAPVKALVDAGRPVHLFQQ